MIWKPIQDSDLPEIQKLHLELIRRSSFNGFDGEIVVTDLLANRDLWIGALMTRRNIGITIRDLPDGNHNVDLLYLSTNKLAALKNLAKRWNTDTCETVEDPGSFLGSWPTKLKILELWWD